jgi:uncharacterized protein
MDLNQIKSKVSSLAEGLRKEGVEHLAIFGSRARGDAQLDSDLDVLIDVAPGRRFSLLNLCGVALLIEDATGIRTEVVLRRSLPSQFADRIADDLVPVL